VEIVTIYDCDQLIDRAMENLVHDVAERFIVVVVVCALFL
jgi:Cu/Ag efflux pump CusA